MCGGGGGGGGGGGLAKCFELFEWGVILLDMVTSCLFTKLPLTGNLCKSSKISPLKLIVICVCSATGWVTTYACQLALHAQLSIMAPIYSCTHLH